MLATFFIFSAHFWEFFFAEPGKHFYESAVWGNVVAVLPLAVVAVLGWLWHKGAVGELHRKLDAQAKRHDELAEHMKKALDLLDPERDGGIADVHAAIAEIKNELSVDTPGGLQVVVGRIDMLGKSVAE